MKWFFDKILIFRKNNSDADLSGLKPFANNAMKKIAYFLLLMLGTLTLSAQQDIFVYDGRKEAQQTIKLARTLEKQQKYGEAIKKYMAVMIVCDEQIKPSQKRINYCVRMIDELKVRAETNEQEAQRQKKRAEINLQKAEKLTSYYGFSETRERAWAYNLEKGKFALINTEGDTLTGFKYTQPQDFTGNNAIVYKNKGYLVLDKNGKELTEEMDFLVERAKGGYLATKNNHAQMAFINAENEFLGWSNDNLVWSNDGFVKLEIDGKTKYLFLNSEKLYDLAYSFSEGLASVRLNDKWGFIDKTGKEIISMKYDDVYNFSENLALVKLNYKWGLIDKTGKEIATPIYGWFEASAKGGFWSSRDGKYVFLDKRGNETFYSEMSKITEKYGNMVEFSEGVARVSKRIRKKYFKQLGDNYKVGYINMKGGRYHRF